MKVKKEQSLRIQEYILNPSLSNKNNGSFHSFTVFLSSFYMLGAVVNKTDIASFLVDRPTGENSREATMCIN